MRHTTHSFVPQIIKRIGYVNCSFKPRLRSPEERWAEEEYHVSQVFKKKPKTPPPKPTQNIMNEFKMGK